MRGGHPDQAVKQIAVRRHHARRAAVVALGLGLLSAIHCSEGGPSAPRITIARQASVAIDPRFENLPAGVPAIPLGRIRGVMTGVAGDSVASDAPFAGDSAVLAFTVSFTGSSARFQLTLTAYDTTGAVAYRSVDTVLVRPGRNPPVTPKPLRYAGPDADVAAIHVVPDTLLMQPGAQSTMSVTGATKDGKRATAAIRVGWLSRADSIAGVDRAGGVHARANEGTTWIVARSASGAVDSALVQVRAAKP